MWKGTGPGITSMPETDGHVPEGRWRMSADASSVTLAAEAEVTVFASLWRG
jgi:hypothetical protein